MDATRTNIEIDEAMLAEAMAVDLSMKQEIVEEASRRLVHSARRRRAIIEMAGHGWEGDLESAASGLPASR